MDSGVLISIILGFASIVSSIAFGIIPSIKRKKIEIMKSELLTLYKDLDSYYQIEELLLTQLCALNNKSPNTMKVEYRRIISEKEGRVLSNNIKPSYITKKIEALS